MSDDIIKSHFLIPDNNIRQEKIIVPPGGTNYQRDDITQHGQQLLRKTELLSISVSRKSDFHLAGSLFLQLSAPPSVSIKNEKLKLKNLGFEILQLFKDDLRRCIAKISKDNFARFQERIYNYTYESGNPGKTNLAILEDVDEIPLASKMSPLLEEDKEHKVIIYLYNDLSRKERFQILNQLESDLALYAGKIESQIFLNGTIAISCRINTAALNDIISSYLTVKQVELNSTFFIKRAVPQESLSDSLIVLPSLSDSVVAIIDSGINSNASVFRGQVTASLLYLPPDAVTINNDHGSFVASRCVYGDEIDDCLGSNVLTPYCKVLDVTVFGEDAKGDMIGPDNFELMNILEDVVKKNHQQVKVYNLSLGQYDPIADYEFSNVAKVIDSLSKTYNVIFVIASGNTDGLLGEYPEGHFSHNNARLGAPAEALLAVTVGSIAKYEHKQGMSSKDEISPFSRIGPGADLGLKPEVVTHGGNLISGFRFLARVASYGIYNNGNQLAVDIGTSFAAPLVSQYIVRLMDAFPGLSPNMIKALLYHFAQRRNISGLISNPHHFYTGFGEPHIENSVFSRPNTLSYIYEGVIDKKSYEYIGFHIPKVFNNTSLTKLKVRITIVFDPDVDAENDFEYSMARISANLYKAQGETFKKIDVDSEDKYHLPWNPIIQFEKEFSRNFSCGYWELRLRLFTRGYLSEKYKQNYAVVVEIIDSKGETDVFDESAKEFGDIYTRYNKRSSAA